MKLVSRLVTNAVIMCTFIQRNRHQYLEYDGICVPLSSTFNNHQLRVYDVQAQFNGSFSLKTSLHPKATTSRYSCHIKTECQSYVSECVVSAYRKPETTLVPLTAMEIKYKIISKNDNQKNVKLRLIR